MLVYPARYLPSFYRRVDGNRHRPNISSHICATNAPVVHNGNAGLIEFNEYQPVDITPQLRELVR